jgi:hypothetical protein
MIGKGEAMPLKGQAKSVFAARGLKDLFESITHVGDGPSVEKGAQNGVQGSPFFVHAIRRFVEMGELFLHVDCAIVEADREGKDFVFLMHQNKIFPFRGKRIWLKVPR